MTMNRIFALGIAGLILTSGVANATEGVTVQSLLNKGFKIVAVVPRYQVYLQKDNEAYVCEWEGESGDRRVLCRRFDS